MRLPEKKGRARDPQRQPLFEAVQQGMEIKLGLHGHET
jgi:hypothetical protein